MIERSSLRLSLLAAALLACSAAGAHAQSTTMLLEAARAQIEDIAPDSAASLLVRVLDRRMNASGVEQIRAWTLLGVVELMRNRQAVARQAFRRALERDANIRVDTLAHLHSDVRTVFATEREAFRIENTDDAPLSVTLRMATDTTVVPQSGRYAFEVRPRRRARVIATLTPAGNENSEPLWSESKEASPVAAFAWDLNTAGRTIRPGRYALRITATDGSTRAPALLTRILMISRMPADTLIPPELPQDSLLPETERSRNVSAVAAGAALGAGALFITAIAGNKDVNGGGADAARYVVAGAVSAAAIIGFVTSKGERWVPENVSFNQEMRDRYEQLQADMTAENRRRIANAPLRIRMEAARMDSLR